MPIPYCWFKLNVDGSVLGKTNQAGAGGGGLIRTWDEKFIEGYCQNLGEASIQFAELWALWKGLQVAESRKINHLIAETDSQFFYHVMQSSNLIEDYDVEMHIALETCRIILRSTSFQVRKIFRENNAAADYLAKVGAYNKTTGSTVHVAPDKLIMIVNNDVHGAIYPRIM